MLAAAAVGVADPYLGEDIAAFVVLKPGASASETDLRAHCTRELGDLKTPTQIHFVDSLPTGPTGKVQRSRLAQRFLSRKL